MVWRPSYAGAPDQIMAGDRCSVALTRTLTRTLSPLPRSDPALTVPATYDHYSGIGNEVLSQEVIPQTLPLTVTPTLSLASS